VGALNTVDLETFIEVAATRSYSVSAKALGVSQVVVKKRLASLEAQLSSGLFDHIGQSVELTEAGRILLPSARQINAEVARIEGALGNDKKPVAGNITIGTTEYVATRQLPSLLALYREKYPDVRISLQFASIEQIVSDVEQGLIDTALCPLHRSTLTSLSSRITATEIWSYNLKVVVAEHDSLVAQANVSLSDLSNKTAILPTSNTLARQAIDDRLASHGLKGHTSVEADNFDTMRSLAAIGMGWTCLPDFEIGEGLAPLHVAQFSLPHSVAFLHHSDITMTNASQAFLDMLRSRAQASTDLR